MKFILAGNHKQYQDCIRELKLRPEEARYIGRYLDALGLRPDAEDVITYGTWFENDWAYHVLKYFKMHQEITKKYAKNNHAEGATRLRKKFVGSRTTKQQKEKS